MLEEAMLRLYLAETGLGQCNKSVESFLVCEFVSLRASKKKSSSFY